MRKPLIAGNWKMNGNSASNQQLLAAILAQRENKAIGHEAHLGGALAGILATIAYLSPSLARRLRPKLQAKGARIKAQYRSRNRG